VWCALEVEEREQARKCPFTFKAVPADKLWGEKGGCVKPLSKGEFALLGGSRFADTF
jgi:hypothetical protein